MKKLKIDLRIIGTIHSPYKTIKEAPRQGTDDKIEIEIFKEFMDGLKDIEGFSYIHVFYWLHKSEGYNLIVNTPLDTIPHGLFTTRSPRRPNPIGHSVVKILKVKDNKLYVKGLDAIDGTPVIDIKSYIKKLDIRNDARSGWTENVDL
jgi:formylmethanofuran dehydrogenase subunit E